MFKDFFIKVKHPEQSEIRIIWSRVYINSDPTVYERLKSDTRRIFKLSNDYDFYFSLTDKDGDIIAITETIELLNYMLGKDANDRLKLNIVPAQQTHQQKLGMNNLQATVEKNAASTVDNVVKTAAETAAHVYRSLLPQASLSEKPQFDVICDGCYSPIRGQRYHCETCDDFDLCSICKCRVNHDPAHNFRLEDKHVNSTDYFAKEKEQELAQQSAACAETSYQPQSVFVCDYCDSDIVGIRHTCGACPDFDLCHSCFSIVKENHPQDHIFVTRLVGTQASTDKSTARPTKKNKQTSPNNTTKAAAVTLSADDPIPTATTQHLGVECDHCQASIEGIRYKCGHCTNYDLCETCEHNSASIHDKTHAFIKIRYPIQSIIKRPLLPKFKELIDINELNDTGKTSVKEMIHTLNEKSQPAPIISKPEEIVSTRLFVPPTTSAVAHVLNPPITETLPITEPTPNTVMDAAFVSDLNVPDGTVIVPKKTFIKMWKLKNTGNVDWPLGSHLLFNGGSILRPYPISRPDCFAVPVISPDEETCVTAELQAPDSPGNYTSFFCLCTPDGERFGDNIWCTIKVDEDLEPEKDKTTTPISPATTTMMSSGSEMIFPTISTATSVHSAQQQQQQQHEQSQSEPESDNQYTYAHASYDEFDSEATTNENASTRASITTRTYTDSQVSSPSPSELDIGERAENAFYNYDFEDGDNEEEEDDDDDDDDDDKENEEYISRAYHVISPSITPTLVQDQQDLAHSVQIEQVEQNDNLQPIDQTVTPPQNPFESSEDDDFVIIDEEHENEEQHFAGQSEMSSSTHSTNTVIPQPSPPHERSSLHDSFVFRSQILQLHEMGFTGYDDLATSLLKLHDGSVDKVVSKLLEYP